MSLEADNHWDIVKELAENLKYNEIIVYCESITDNESDRIKLYRLVIRCLMFRDWTNKSLHPVRLISEEAISIVNKLIKENPDSIEYKDLLNVIYYNMSANFAPCWNDGFNRCDIDYLIGLEYAERSIELRTELKSNNKSFYMAYWAKAIHLLFLKRFNEALESFKISHEYAIKYSQENDIVTTISPNASFLFLLSSGYLAIIEIVLGNHDSLNQYNEVISTFEYQKNLSDEIKEDAIIGIDQLQNTLALLKIF